MRRPTHLQILGALMVAALCAFFAAGIVTSIQTKGLGSSDAAGWIQAIGATIGIAIAVWVPYKQRSDAERDEEIRRLETSTRICSALKDELQAAMEGLGGPIFDALMEDVRDKHFTWETPSASNPHPIFDALAAQIIHINEPQTRQSIIKAYDASDHLRELIALNTRYLHRHRDVQMASKRDAPFQESRPHREHEDLLKQQLVYLRPQLREATSNLLELTQKAIKDLDESIQLNASQRP